MNPQLIQLYQEQKGHFESSIREQVERYKSRFFGARSWSVFVSPIIYVMVIPLAFLDLTIFLYQHICFRFYGIPIVKRRNYFIIDRYHLSYLSGIEKFNCVYCGYANGLAAYAKEIIARTEQFWCPIKHASRVEDPHSRYGNFFEYGDAEGYRRNLDKVACKYET
ncbi:MAG: hypothetical protein AB1453_15460 [Chloroflexota bacterium]